jgi:peptide/nickel transport system substrate-binding protein
MKRFRTLHRRITVGILVLCMAFALCACGGADGTEPSAETKAEKIVRIGDLFANTYTSLDPAQDSNGWWTACLGMSETLFRINDDYSVTPWLAESAEADGSTWTITLRDNVVFSDGTKLTAEKAVESLQHAAEVVDSSPLAAADIRAVDEKTLTIETETPIATLPNILTAPAYSMAILTGDTVLFTGPFSVSEFEPGVSIKGVRNENYWDGEVKLDGVEGKYIADADTLSMAFQNGEIDAYIGPTTNDLELFSASPDKYTVVSTPSSRLYYYYLNMERLPDKDLRAAINMSINSDEICDLLSGLVSSTVGAYGPDTVYGNVTKNPYNPEKAKQLIEGLGYTLDADGYYAKDGKEIELDIAYYAARSIDKIVLLMQEQLKNVGIKATLTASEDPDGTYITTHDFDIGMYCMIANPSADPYYFLDRIVGGGLYTSGGYHSDDASSKLAELAGETDTGRRAELAVEIQQDVIDDEAMGFIALLNKITCMRSGVSHCSETNPVSFYFLNADTDIAG